jgi:glycosyltransferase involved in cell wall biosynthesis
MKVLHITNNYPTIKHPVYGIFVKEQINSLDLLGFKNEIFFINGKEHGKKEYIKSVFKLRRHLKSNNYDVLHCHHSFSAVVLILTFKFIKFKTLVSYQNDPKWEGGFWLNKILLRIMNAVIYKHKKQNSFSQKIHYLPNGVNIDFFKPASRSKSKEILNLCHEKEYIIFMDSNLGRSQKRIDRFKSVINIMKNDLGREDIEPLILTKVSREKMPIYLNACSLHLITSDFEGSPNSVKECLACDIKIVSTPVGDVEELIGDVPGCYVSKSFETKELAHLAIKALDSSEINGREFIQKKQLEASSVGKKLQRIYESI